MTIINTTLNDVFKSTPLGNYKSSIGTALYGINHRQTPGRVPINQDGYGLTLMTRPQLNMSTGNLRALRQFIPLLTVNETSIPRMIRKLLDPRLASGDGKLDCPLMDDKCAFIPILSNHMLSSSGWPDPFVEVHTSKPGVYKETFSIVDGVVEQYHSFDISTTFRNMLGDPITALVYVWCLYMAAVFRGDMVPYPDFIAYNEIDYNTRIYRLVLDRTKRFVQKIACTGAAFPKNVPLGQAFNFEHDHPINSANDQIGIQWQANGVCYQDPIVIYEFNKTVAIFNPDMSDASGRTSVQLLSPSELQLFNNRGYPRINPDTMEMEWYASIQDYNTVMSAFTRNSLALKPKK